MIKFKNNMTKKDGILFLVALFISAILFLIDLFTKNIIINNIGWGEEKRRMSTLLYVLFRYGS